MSNIYKTYQLLFSCWAYLPIRNGVTTLHHNPQVGWGEERVPQGGKVNQESLAWLTMKMLAQSQVIHSAYVSISPFYKMRMPFIKMDL